MLVPPIAALLLAPLSIPLPCTLTTQPFTATGARLGPFDAYRDSQRCTTADTGCVSCLRELCACAGVNASDRPLVRFLHHIFLPFGMLWLRFTKDL
jgi:hypothetical protein